MKTINKLVAVEQLKSNHEEKKEVRGLDLSDKLTAKLIGTTALFDSEKFNAGDTLYFRSDALKLPFNMNKLKMGEIEFVLMPEDLVVGVKGA